MSSVEFSTFKIGKWFQSVVVTFPTLKIAIDNYSWGTGLPPRGRVTVCKMYIDIINIIYTAASYTQHSAVVSTSYTQHSVVVSSIHYRAHHATRQLSLPACSDARLMITLLTQAMGERRFKYCGLVKYDFKLWQSIADLLKGTLN